MVTKKDIQQVIGYLEEVRDSVENCEDYRERSEREDEITKYLKENYNLDVFLDIEGPDIEDVLFILNWVLKGKVPK